MYYGVGVGDVDLQAPLEEIQLQAVRELFKVGAEPPLQPTSPGSIKG